MKQLLTFGCALVFALTVTAQNWKPGMSAQVAGEGAKEFLAAVKDAGMEYIEVTMNPMWRRQPENEVYAKAYEGLANIRESGLKVWSVHLPFSKALDISVTDPVRREENLQLMERMIRLAGIFEPTCLILHPGADTVKDEEERQERLKCSRNSIGRLALAAKDIGAYLCVEVMPRTAPGRTAEEIDYLTAGIPNVKVCFDTNHQLIDTHQDLFDKVGDRIATIHVSDYDRVDEKHWIPFHEKGVVDWGAFYRNLKKSGYKGVFMFEVKKTVWTPDQLMEAYDKIKRSAK